MYYNFPLLLLRCQDYTVRNLRPDTAYMFLIRAQNSHGLSLPSSVTEPIRTKGGNPAGRRPNLPPYEIDVLHEKLTGEQLYFDCVH